MGGSYDKLACLLEESIEEEEYLYKNKKIYIKVANNRLRKIVAFKKSMEKFYTTDNYREKRDKLEKAVDSKFKVIWNSNVSIKELIEYLNELEKIKEELNEGSRNIQRNYDILFHNEEKKLKDEYVIKFTNKDRFNRLLFERLKERYFSNYTGMKIKSIGKFVEDTDLMLKIYNSLIETMGNGIKLKKSSEVTYETVKKDCMILEECIYYTNILMADIFNIDNIVVIKYSNYKEVVEYDKNINLLENVEINIALFFKKALKDRYYMISAKAYFSLLQDLKELRKKSQCLICGKKLRIFSTKITCKEHHKDEWYL